MQGFIVRKITYSTHWQILPFHGVLYVYTYKVRYGQRCCRLCSNIVLWQLFCTPEVLNFLFGIWLDICNIFLLFLFIMNTASLYRIRIRKNSVCLYKIHTLSAFFNGKTTPRKRKMPSISGRTDACMHSENYSVTIRKFWF